jgi:hypothetical protein
MADGKPFFFEKKNQKTIVRKALALPHRGRQTTRSFCFFFQKEALSGCPWVTPNASWY